MFGLSAGDQSYFQTSMLYVSARADKISQRRSQIWPWDGPSQRLLKKAYQSQLANGVALVQAFPNPEFSLWEHFKPIAVG